MANTFQSGRAGADLRAAGAHSAFHQAPLSSSFPSSATALKLGRVIFPWTATGNAASAKPSVKHGLLSCLARAFTSPPFVEGAASRDDACSLSRKARSISPCNPGTHAFPVSHSTAGNHDGQGSFAIKRARAQHHLSMRPSIRATTPRARSLSAAVARGDRLRPAGVDAGGKSLRLHKSRCSRHEAAFWLMALASLRLLNGPILHVQFCLFGWVAGGGGV